jgi:TRAP-type transport system small permease protein
MRHLERVYDLLFRAADVVLVLIAVLIFGAVTTAVFFRYVLNSSVPWADELPALALIWLTFLGAAVLSRHNENLSFDGVSAALPESVQRGLEVFNSVLILIFLAVLVYYGWQLTALTWSRPTVTLPFSMGLVRLIVPVSGLLMMMVYLIRIYRAIRGLPLASPEDVY